MSAARSLLSLSLSLALGAAGCTKTDGEPKAEAATPDAKAAEGKEEAKAEAADEGQGDATPKSVTKAPVGDPTALAAAVASMVEQTASYPVELDPLLDLLPPEPAALVVIRDVEDLLAATDSTLVPVGPAMRSFADALGSAGDVDKVLSGYDGFQAGLRGSDFDLDKGMAIGDLGGEAVVIYGTSTPDALPKLLRSLGAEGDDLPDDCAAIEGSPGYAACTAKPETLARYEPAKAAAAVRTRLGVRLEPTDVEQANVLALVAQDPDPRKQVAFGVATAPGLVHMTVGLGEVPPEAVGVMGVGESPGLGLIDPGSGFYWLKVDPKMIESKSGDAPLPMRNMLGSLTGEVLLGTMNDPRALVLLAGIDDPAPAAAFVSLAGLKVGDIPKTLPDGSTLEVVSETLSVDGKDVQVLHATLGPAGDGAELLAKMGFVPEAWLFAAGGYTGVAFGGDEAVVEAIARYGGGVMSPESARALPKPMAQGLVDHSVALAMYFSIDGIQSPQVLDSFAKVTKDIPSTDLPAGVTPQKLMELVRSFVAPVSGMSMWMAPPDERFAVHVAYSLLGDPRTEEGKAALAAMAEVAQGGDAAAIYGAMATRFPSSPRVTAYQARAGTRGDGALASAAILGVLAAVAIPAFVKYQQRSKEAVAEAEAAAVAAELAAAEAAAAAAAK